MKTFIDFVYTLLIGIAVTLFVSLGIWAFYSGPQFPEYPRSISTPAEGQEEKFQKEQDEYDKQYRQYDEANKTYSKRVAGIALASGAVFFIGGLWLMKRNEVVGEGLALGGIFTAVYATTRAAISDFKQLVFASVTILLAMLIVLALYRMRIQNPPKKSKK